MTDHAPSDAPYASPPVVEEASTLPPRTIAAITLLTLLPVAVAIAASRAAGQDWWILLRDPATAFGFVPYVGLFSHLGVLAMTASGAITAFAAGQLPRGRQRRILLAVGLFTLWLALDDLFMLHESLIPKGLGLPEPLVLGLYVLVAMGIVALIGPGVVSRRYLGFWAAVGCLALMLVTDMLVSQPTSPSFLIEEAAKLCGFVLWSAFWIAEARAALTTAR